MRSRISYAVIMAVSVCLIIGYTLSNRATAVTPRTAVQATATDAPAASVDEPASPEAVATTIAAPATVNLLELQVILHFHYPSKSTASHYSYDQ